MRVLTNKTQEDYAVCFFVLFFPCFLFLCLTEIIMTLAVATNKVVSLEIVATSAKY